MTDKINTEISGHTDHKLSIKCGFVPQPRVGGRRKHKHGNTRNREEVKHLHLVLGKDGYYWVVGVGRIAFCSQTANRLSGTVRLRRHMVLKMSRRPKRGFIRLKFCQLASIHDPHDVRVFDGLLPGIPRVLFKFLAYAIAKLKGWASFCERSGFVYLSVRPC